MAKKYQKQHTYTLYEKPKKLEIKRGDVYWAKMKGADGDMYKNRPVIVISNDKCNEHSEVVTIVPLTSQIDERTIHLPTHVKLKDMEMGISVAKCEQITSLNKSQIKGYMRTLSDYEMRKIAFAVMVQVGVI